MFESTNNSIQNKLLEWYDDTKKVYPWTDVADPYKIWLSEIMLQQTQIKTVLPYYERWLSMFPNIQSVADANFDLILKYWEGLGYYARARNFFKACKILSENHSGKVPSSPELFLSLPGVGRYTAGAVMSISYNYSVPAVDCNTARIITRFNCINKIFPKSLNNITMIVSDIICKNRPGDFNQALMNLGREICIPKKPKCNICPIKYYCKAFVNNTVNKFPVVIDVKPKKHYRSVAGIIWENNKFLVIKKKNNGLLGGLWQFPGGNIYRDENPKYGVIRSVKQKIKIKINPTSYIGNVKHSYSHFSITMDAYHCNYIGGQPKSFDFVDIKWIYISEINNLPFSGVYHKLIDKINWDEVL